MTAVKCAGCAREFFKRDAHEVKRSPRHFCSRACLPTRTCACGATFRARWASSTDCKACREAAFRGRTKPQKKVADAAYYAANAEAIKARARDWYSENRKRAREAGYRWVKAHPDARRLIARRYRDAHPEIFVARWQRRRARVRNAAGSFTAAEWAAVVRKQRGRCAKCGKKAPLDADHIIPLAAGGSNYIFNIQGLCGPCNGSKGAKIIPGSQSTLFDRTDHVDLTHT